MADKTLQEHIVSFRVTKDQANSVTDKLKEEPIIGIRSVSQFFRKVGRDFLAGRLVYKNPQDAFVDSDLGR